MTWRGVVFNANNIVGKLLGRGVGGEGCVYESGTQLAHETVSRAAVLAFGVRLFAVALPRPR